MKMLLKNKKKLILIALLLVSAWSFKKFYFDKADVSEKQLSTAITKGKVFFQEIQQPNGAIADSTNPLFNLWETALVAKTLFLLDKNDKNFLKALNFLKVNQNADGLLCHNLKCKAGYCIETSSIYLQLLMDLKGKDSIRNQIKKIADLQQKAGNWLVGNPDVREKPDFPSTTFFALNILRKASVEPLYKNEMIRWIISKQNEEGHWGKTWEYYDTPAYALWQMAEATSQINTPEMMKVKQKAIDYIIDTQKSDGSWGEDDVSTFNIRPSKELETALMLAAMQSFSENKYSVLEKPILKSISFLLSKQRGDGSWDGGFFPIKSPIYEKHEYIFATSLIISTLHTFQSQKKTK